ncbi:MAG: HEAT repeat domain-containing protein [Thermoguttaceae bacterium]|nr:HEAT repeat domain-containing protein [Thermoguttaceae bacterium]MDW8039465.1 HEAT repeat domain-containing protein [Thermoguttaceae bacterium]
MVRQTVFHVRWVLVGLWGLLGLAGCEALDLTDPGRFWPFQKESFTDQVPGVSTPKERREALKRLCERANRAGPEEHQRIADGLAQAYRQEEDPALRAEIVRTLGRFPTPTTLQMLRQAVTDPDAEVRIAACEALSSLGGPEAVELLAGLVQGETDQDVRLAAVRALGKTGDERAKEALRYALTHGDPALQRRAMLALKELTGQDFGGDAKKWREYLEGGQPQPQRRLWIADRLQQLWEAL